MLWLIEKYVMIVQQKQIIMCMLILFSVYTCSYVDDANKVMHHWLHAKCCHQYVLPINEYELLLHVILSHFDFLQVKSQNAHPR